jgi:Innexin
VDLSYATSPDSVFTSQKIYNKSRLLFVLLTKQGKNQHTIVYYQWIPVILLLQAFMFCLPRIFWMTFADHSGVDVGSFVESGGILTLEQMDNSVRESIIKQMTSQVDR